MRLVPNERSVQGEHGGICQIPKCSDLVNLFAVKEVAKLTDVLSCGAGTVSLKLAPQCVDGQVAESAKARVAWRHMYRACGFESRPHRTFLWFLIGCLIMI